VLGQQVPLGTLKVFGDRRRIDVDPDLVDLAAIEGVDSARSADGVLRVVCSDPRAKARVVTRLTNAGIDVLDVDSGEASLEDVFAAYTTDAEGLEAEADEPATVEEVVP